MEQRLSKRCQKTQKKTHWDGLRAKKNKRRKKEFQCIFNFPYFVKFFFKNVEKTKKKVLFKLYKSTTTRTGQSFLNLKIGF